MATAPTTPFTFALVGAGSVGTAVAELLRRAGNRPLAVASRSPESAKRAAEMLGCEVVDATALPACDVVLLGVPAEAIEEVAWTINPTLQEGTIVIHFAGSRGLEPLRPVMGRGGQRVALHPVQACPDIETAIARIPGSAWGCVCDEGLGDWSADLIEQPLGGFPYWVPDVQRAMWHAAATVTSNALSAVLAIGESMLLALGHAEPAGVLGPLARGTLQNAIEGGGGAQTITGPAVRGEVATIERHLEGIDLWASELKRAYGLATLLTIEAAVAADRIPSDVAEEMLELLRKNT